MDTCIVLMDTCIGFNGYMYWFFGLVSLLFLLMCESLDGGNVTYILFLFSDSMAPIFD